MNAATQSQRLKHLLSAEQLTPAFLEKIYLASLQIEKIRKGPIEGRIALRKLLEGRDMLEIFTEASTRTWGAHAVAAKWVGLGVIDSQDAAHTSSLFKDESKADHVRTLLEMGADVLVMRDDEANIPMMAAAISDEYGFGIPVVNAGDASHQHPSQGLVDYCSIRRRRNTLDGTRFSFFGDNQNSRTVRTLVQLASQYQGVRMNFYSPVRKKTHECLRPSDDILTLLKNRGVQCEIIDEKQIPDALRETDVLNVTRVQKARFDKDNPPTNDEVTEMVKTYQVGLKQAALMPNSSIITHPLPRFKYCPEILPEVDGDARAVYFQAIFYGTCAKAATFLELFDVDMEKQLRWSE